MEREYDIFISYRRVGGKNYARTIKPELEKRGFRVFLDFDELKDGVFDQRIMNAIEEAPVFLLILSEGALDRCVNEGDWVREEILHAQKTRRHIVPVEVDKTFRKLPDNLPSEIADIIGAHTWAQIDTETLLQVSMNEMVRDRIQKYITQSPLSIMEEKHGADIHIETDIDCNLYRFKEFISIIHPNEDNILYLKPGNHKIEVSSLRYPDIKSMKVVSIPSDNYTDFLEFTLKIVVEKRIKEEEEIRLRKRVEADEAFKIGKQYQENNNYEEALHYFAKAAELGSIQAQYQVGDIYYYGKTGYQDDGEAEKWYLKSAENGCVEAQYSLGNLYLGSKKPEKNAEAAKWLQKAAESGHVTAQYNLGFMYHNGWGVTKDYKKAVMWYNYAAQKGSSDAQYSLGQMFYWGDGVDRNYETAIKWFLDAALQNNTNAQYNLGFIYENGIGIPPNYPEAIKWYTKAALNNNLDAMYNLGSMYKSGKGVNQEMEEAFKWIKKASDLGDSKAQNALGEMYYYGEGVSQNDDKAASLFMKSAEQGNAAGQNNLAWMYEKGLGVEQSDNEAIKWYRKSAEQGNKDAQKALKLLQDT